MEKEENERGKISIIDRIKNIKHLDIIIAVTILIIALAIYFGFLSKPKDVVITSEDNAKFISRLEEVVSQIDGIGKTKIIINYDDNTRITIAERVETESKVEADGSITIMQEKKEPIIIRNGKEDKPIIIDESNNAIKGVIVVAKGGGNPIAKIKLIEAISTLLDIDNDQIKIYEMK